MKSPILYHFERTPGPTSAGDSSGAMNFFVAMGAAMHRAVDAVKVVVAAVTCMWSAVAHRAAATTIVEAIAAKWF